MYMYNLTGELKIDIRPALMTIREDNAGRVHLATMDSNGDTVYLHVYDDRRDAAPDFAEILYNDGDPIGDSWDGNDLDKYGDDYLEDLDELDLSDMLYIIASDYMRILKRK